MQHVIKVESLSKRYRLGLKESRKDTLMGQIAQTLRAPLDNLKRLRSMTRFGEEDESVFWALRDINFEVTQGEVLGIIGHNGAGKSTLLKILSRITEPTSGRITINGRIAALLEVGTGFHQDLTGRENIYMNGTILGMTRKEIDRKLDEIVDFSGVEKHLDTPVKFYSSGMKVRLGFAVAAHLEPEILIVDEVLAVGDLEFQNKCLRKMGEISSEGRTILFVSHNMASIKAFCKRVIVLNKGKAEFDGNVSEAIFMYLDISKKEEMIGGVIPENMSVIYTKQAKFKRFHLLNSAGIATSTFQFNDFMVINLEVEVLEKLNKAIIDVKLVSKEGLELVHLANLYENIFFDLEPGRHALMIKFKCKLQPSRYYLTLGIHGSNGYTLDYIESICQFEVMNGLPVSTHWLHGSIVQNAEWIMNKI